MVTCLNALTFYSQQMGVCTDGNKLHSITNSYSLCRYIVLTFSKITGNLHLPLNEPLPSIEGENYCHILTDYCYGVGLFIQGKP